MAHEIILSNERNGSNSSIADMAKQASQNESLFEGAADMIVQEVDAQGQSDAQTFSAHALSDHSP